MSSNSTGISSLRYARSLAVDALRISSCVNDRTSYPDMHPRSNAH